MGRPSASSQNKVLGICFAKTMCKATDNKKDFVPRSGPFSMFQAIKELYPLCIREETFFRDGLNEVQLNKALQNAGFQRVRDRRAQAIKRTEDPTGAGMYLFSNLKWRDPQDPVDRNHLTSGWKAICERFPMVGQRCDSEKFLATVTRFHDGWQPNAERMNNSALFDVEEEHEQNVQPLTPRMNSMPHRSALAANTNNMQHTHDCEQQSSPSIAPLQHESFIGQPPHAFQELIRLQLELAKAQTLSLLQVQMAQNKNFARTNSNSSSLSIPHTSPILPPVKPRQVSASPSLPPLNLNSATLPPLDLEPPMMKPMNPDRISPLAALREGTNTAFQGFHDCEMQKSADAFSDSQLRLNLNSLVRQ